MEQFSTDSAVQRYLPLMHELSIRIDLVAHACDGKLNLTPPYAREFAYLQFRHICELIALGCLLLHGDLPSTQTQSTKKEWNAEKIMRTLYKSYPHWFPQSVIREKTPIGWNIKANSKPNALTIDGFKKLYLECGEVLHRGTIRSLEFAGNITKEDYQKVIDWQGKIIDLMNEHLIGRATADSYYLISLRTESEFPECSICTLNKATNSMDITTLKMNIISNK